MGLGATGRAGMLAFLTAAVTLFVQVLAHRMVSAKLLNNFAFLVISLSMLGFALSGVVLSRYRDRLLEDRDESVVTSAAAFVLSLLGASVLFYRLEAGQQAFAYGHDFALQIGQWLPLALPWTIPFAFCGLILGLLLSDVRLPTGRIYFADLVGSAVGAFVVIVAIRSLGVEWSLVAGAAVMLIFTALLAPPRTRLARAAVLVAGVATLVVGVQKDSLFEMRYPENSPLWHIQQLPEPYGIEYIAWDPVTRIEISRNQPPDHEKDFAPSLIGTNREFHQRFRRMLTQNNHAFTHAVEYDGRPASLEGIEETVYAAAYHASSVEAPEVLVIGVGGGFDVLTALHFEPNIVTGVEVNEATIDVLTRVYRDYFAPWVEDPRVNLVAAEGRHFLATHEGPWDVIQLSGVDSYSGTPGAAHVFSEAYIYTAEAFDLYLSRLSPDGIMNMMRVDSHPVPRDMLRALATAVGALRRAGVEQPSRHVVTLTEVSGNYTALLMKKTPFTAEEIGRLEEWAETNPLLLLSAGPGLNGAQANQYQMFLARADQGEETRYLAQYPLNVWPVGDDRPFYFKSSYWSHVFSSDPLLHQFSPPVMEYTLLMLLVVVGVAAVVCVYVPLRFLAARGRHVQGAARYGVFFAALGLGYLAVEVALLQKFGLFLGHPNFALSVVLASLLFTTGLGSLMAEGLLRRVGTLRVMSYILAGVILVEYLVILPWLPGLIGLPFAARVLVVFLLVAPLGLCLGTFFPTALDRLKPDSAEYVPWAWGINGIFSVLAPVLSVGISMTWGIGALLLSAIPIYLVAGLVLPEGVASPAGGGEPSA